jgi:curli biogenesis system outer membrane secretion channel CsgG
MTGQAAVVLALLAMAGPAAAQPAGVGTGVDRLRVGVLDLSGSALKTQTAVVAAGGPGGYTQQVTTTVALPPPAEFARGLTEMLTTALVATNRFVVLERAQVGAVMQEQDLGASGRVARETAPAQGGVIGAQALITGDITGFSYSSEALGGNLANVIKGVTAGASRVTAEVVIDLRLVDAVTGEVLGSASGRGKASATGVSADLTKGERNINAEGAKATPLGQASRAAIRNAVADLLRQAPKALAWARRVIDVRDGLVYVNSGRGDGLEPGTILQAFEQAQALIDPDTGRNLGNPDRLLGELQVESVEERYSVAKVLSGQGFARNHLVRIKPR